MSEIALTLAWLGSVCGNISGLNGGIHRGVAPALTPTPFLVVSQYGGADVAGVAGTRLWANNTWLIETWGPDVDFAAVDAVASAVDAAVHGQANIILPGGGRILSSVREQPRMAFEVAPGGTNWVRVGGIYRIEARQ